MEAQMENSHHGFILKLLYLFVTGKLLPVSRRTHRGILVTVDVGHGRRRSRWTWPVSRRFQPMSTAIRPTRCLRAKHFWISVTVATVKKINLHNFWCDIGGEHRFVMTKQEMLKSRHVVFFGTKFPVSDISNSKRAKLMALDFGPCLMGGVAGGFSHTNMGIWRILTGKSYKSV